MPPHNPNACYAVSSPPIPKATVSLNNNSTNPSNSQSSTNGNNMAGGVQQQQQQQQKNPKLYKTELCRSWMEHGRCNYGERCQYAHGEREKRPVPRHPKYKTEACQSYHKTGYCPYGPRCHFIHNENPSQLKALIEQNEKALRMVQELAVIPTNGSASEIPRKSLAISSSSASLGNSPFGCVLQKNNSVHAFSHFHGQYLEKAQSNGALQQNQQQENCAHFFPFHNAIQQQQQQHNHAHHHQSPQQQLPAGLGLNLLAHSNNNGTNNMLQYQHQQQDAITFFSPQQCSPAAAAAENRHSQQTLTSSSYEIFSGISPKQQSQRAAELFEQGRMTSPQQLSNHHHQHGHQHKQQSPLAHSAGHLLSSFGTEQQHQQKHQQFDQNGQAWHLAHQMHGNCANGTNFAAGAISATSRDNNSNSELDAQHLLANLCSSDDDYSHSSLVSSTADSGTESPPMTLAFDDDTLTKSKDVAKKLLSAQLIGQTNLCDETDEGDSQFRRSSDGDTVKVNMMISACSANAPTDHHRHNHSTASSSLASLLSSSSSSNAQHAHHHHHQQHQQQHSYVGISNKSPTAMPTSAKIRLPVFERLSLNQ